MKNLKSLIKTSKNFFPTSKNMQRQWVRKTVHLEQTGKHSKLTGGWPLSLVNLDSASM